MLSRGTAGTAASRGWRARWDSPTKRVTGIARPPYLAAETEVIQETLEALRRGVTSSLVIDTTESAVYTREELCRGVQPATAVICLESSIADLESLFEEHARSPRAKDRVRSVAPSENAVAAAR